MRVGVNPTTSETAHGLVACFMIPQVAHGALQQCQVIIRLAGARGRDRTGYMQPGIRCRLSVQEVQQLLFRRHRLHRQTEVLELRP